MSDDFDRHDDDFDWLDDDDGDESSSDRSGLTGELSWQQDAESSPDGEKRSDTDDLELDWLESGGSYETRDVKGDSTGVTGELSWLEDADAESTPDAQSSGGDTDALDWMQSSDEEPETPTDINEVPDWLQPADAGDESVEDEPEQPQSFGLTGMFDDMADDDDDTETDGDSPQWLSNMGETGALSEDIDDHPDWLQNVGDTGVLNRDEINRQLDSLDTGDADESPDWLSGMGIGESSTDDSEVEDALPAETPDWLTDLAPEATDEPTDTEDAFPDMDTMFGFDDDDYGDDEPEPAEGDASMDWLTEYDDDDEFSSSAEVVSDQPASGEEEPVEHDTGWLDYDDADDDEEYDPYAQYDDLEDDEEYEQVFQTGDLDDTGSLPGTSDLFDTEQPVSDPTVSDDTPDWLAAYSEESFETEAESASEETEASTPDEWLTQFDGETFDDIGTGELASDSIDDVPDWLQADDAVSSEADEVTETPAMEFDDFMADVDDELAPDPIDDVPDWLQADDAVSSEADEVAETPAIEFDDFMADVDDELETLSTGITDDLNAMDDVLDFDDLESSGLTGELPDIDEIGADLLADLDIGDVGDLDDLGEIDLDDLDIDLDDLSPTGLTGELEAVDDDLDLSFLDEVEVGDEAESVGEAFADELEADDDLDLSFLDEVEVGDEAEPVGEAFADELEADDEMDLSFLDEVEVGDEAESVSESADAFEADDEELDLSFLDEVADDEGTDWFEESEEPVIESEPEWMRTLDEADVDDLVADDADLEELFGDESLENAVFESGRTQVPAADLDSLLATFDEVEDDEFAEDESLSRIDDLDAIFDAALSQDDEVDELPDHIPEWLRDADISSDESSAAAIIRQQSDKPIEELDERLQALRNRALSVSSESAEAPPSDLSVLKGVPETLATPQLEHEAASVVSDIQLTSDQQSQAELLQKIVGVTITPTVETDEEGTPIVQSSRRRRRALPNVGLGRLLVATLLLLVMILPFVSNFGVGNLPPLAFGGDQQNANAVFNEMQSLNEGDWVLVGVEYGPTGAGELDTVTDILLRHVFAQGAKPIIVSSNPVAIVHVQNILNEIHNAVKPSGLSLQPNQDYYIVRYLSGGTLGLRDLSQNFDSVVSVNARGNPTNLKQTSLDEMALMIVIAERSDDIRSWAEQVAPSTHTRLLAATGYSAQPLAEPYVNQTDGIVGLMVGYRDAFTYGEMLQGIFATATPAPTDTPTLTPTVTNTPLPTDTPVPTNTPEPTDEEDAQSAETAQAVDGATDGEQATATPLPTDTPAPTETPIPTDTPTATASNTPEPTSTSTATATPNLISVIVVRDGNGSVNVRTGPSTNDSVLTTASAGDVYQVISTNADGSWINFLLPDGRDGWIAAFLVDQIDLPEDEFQNSESEDSADAGGVGVVVLRIDFNRRMGKNGARVLQQAPTETLEATLTPSITPSPTMTPTATVTPSPTADPRAGYAFARDRHQEISRLNAMTMGTIAAVVIILFGNIYFGLRAVAQRRRESKR